MKTPTAADWKSLQDYMQADYNQQQAQRDMDGAYVSLEKAKTLCGAAKKALTPGAKELASCFWDDDYEVS